MRAAERARAKLHGEGVDEGRQVQVRDTVKRWVRAEGVDLDNEAQKAKQNLRNVDRTQH